MSTACASNCSSISVRIPSVQGSAPKMPTWTEQALGSRPWRRISSMIASM